MGIALTVFLGAYSSMVFLGEFSGVQAKVMNALSFKAEDIKKDGYSISKALDGTKFVLEGIASESAEGVIFFYDIENSDQLVKLRLLAKIKINDRIVGEIDVTDRNASNSRFELITFIPK